MKFTFYGKHSLVALGLAALLGMSGTDALPVSALDKSTGSDLAESAASLYMAQLDASPISLVDQTLLAQAGAA